MKTVTVTQRIKELEHIRDWLHSHPAKVDPDVKPAAIDWLNGEIAGMQTKTTNRVRSRLAVRIKTILVALIVSYENERRQGNA